MLINPPPKFRPHRRIKSSLPANLVLVAAGATSTAISLTFDRDVNPAGIVVAQFIYNDPVSTNQQYIGTGTVIVVGPTEIRVRLAAAGAATGAIQMLTAGAGNGLVAPDNNGTWPGVNGLELPFGG